MLPSTKNIQIIEDTIRKNNTEGKFEDRIIIIFGCTLYAADIIREIRSYGYEPYGFIDNDKKKVGGLCSGISVYRPAYIKEIDSEKLRVIVASPSYAREMEGQLKELGLKDNNIIRIPVCNPNIDEELSEKKVEERLNLVKNGINLYEKLTCQNKNIPVLLFPYPGTGDIYMACGYLYAYIKKRGITSPILVVSKENCRQVAELFGYSDIRVISEYDMKKLLLAWQFVGSKKMKMKPLLFWGWETKYYFRGYRNHKNMSFADYFKYDVFDLDEEDIFLHPKSRADLAYAETLFIERQLKSGKTVILAPYAGSFVSAITKKVWVAIADLLRAKGYDVCTNCYGKEEPIPGTGGIQFPYEQAVNVLNYAGGFIGVRSGLCDVVSSSTSNLTVIYESNYLASDYEYFSLKKMGLNDCVNELEFRTGELLLESIDKLYK